MLLRMSVVDRIIQHFDGTDGRGGQAKFARALKHKNVTTVQGWSERGAVPFKKIPQVIAVCGAHGLSLDYSDFFKDVIGKKRSHAEARQ